MNKKLRLGIVGATGYVGAELVRVLASHPNFEIASLVSQSYVGQKFSDIYPALRGRMDLVCEDLDIDRISSKVDVLITALPHRVSSHYVPLFLEKGIRVLDHSGDFRYKDVKAYEAAYDLKHPAPHLLKDAVYGLPELYRQEITSAKLVANPGCYPTCTILGLIPLLAKDLIKADSIIVNAVSGITGAGRKADIAYNFCEAAESFRAYAVSGHRHVSEMEEVLGLKTGNRPTLTFTPHLAPLKRGMLATIYADPKGPISEADLHDLYEDYYKDEYFVRVLDPGLVPDTVNVAVTNFADIAVFKDERTNKIKILSAIDNLGKGASLQAVQALNIMMGIDERTGLV